jgi:hypothetical protein
VLLKEFVNLDTIVLRDQFQAIRYLVQQVLLDQSLMVENQRIALFALQDFIVPQLECDNLKYAPKVFIVHLVQSNQSHAQ